MFLTSVFFIPCSIFDINNEEKRTKNIEYRSKSIVNPNSALKTYKDQ